MDGILRCSRYAFGPNRLHYCGPDANKELLAYINHGANDPGLEKIMQAFQTLYPYLNLIARSNGVRDSFDNRVVEAYWIGNALLENVERQSLFRNLLENHQLKKKIGQKSFSEIESKIGEGALPHHSFHVFNVWRRTGNLDAAHTIESMDSCRVGWGSVSAIDGPAVTVRTEPLAYREGHLLLGKEIEKRISRNLESTSDIEQMKLGDIVTFHWGIACEVITPEQASILKRYTLKSIALANQTL